MKYTIILLGALLIAVNCNASGDFKCIVKESFTLENNGKLSTETSVAKSKINKEFIVNRQTGQMTGSSFINTMSGQMPTVYDYLPSENGYKAITIYKPNNTIDYLQINEYSEGKEKPFLYKGAWGEIVTGVCVTY